MIKDILFYSFAAFHLTWLMLVQIPILFEQAWNYYYPESSNDYFSVFSSGWIELTQDPILTKLSNWYLATVLMGLFIQLPVLFCLSSSILKGTVSKSVILVCYYAHLITAIFPVFFQLTIALSQDQLVSYVPFILYTFQLTVPIVLMTLEMTDLVKVMSKDEKVTAPSSPILTTPKREKASKRRQGFVGPPSSPTESALGATPPLILHEEEPQDY